MKSQSLWAIKYEKLSKGFDYKETETKNKRNSNFKSKIIFYLVMTV